MDTTLPLQPTSQSAADLGPARSGTSPARPAPVLTRLREMIAKGELRPGQRVTEVELAEHMGVSRTPIRQALPLLAQEGLLSRVGARGYEVRAFNVRDILDGLDVRGAIEGLAARAVAERGVPAALIAQLQQCLAEGDAVLSSGTLASAEEAAYVDMNRRFHALIVDAAGSPVYRQALERNNSIPFAAADAPVFSATQRDKLLEILRYAHRQHHAIVDALQRGQGARLEALFREHVFSAKTSLDLVTDTLERGETALAASAFKLSLARLIDA